MYKQMAGRASSGVRTSRYAVTACLSAASRSEEIQVGCRRGLRVMTYFTTIARPPCIGAILTVRVYSSAAGFRFVLVALARMSGSSGSRSRVQTWKHIILVLAHTVCWPPLAPGVLAHSQPTQLQTCILPTTGQARNHLHSRPSLPCTSQPSRRMPLETACGFVTHAFKLSPPKMVT